MANDLTPERIKRLEEIDKAIGAPIGWGVSHIMRESKGEKGATFKERDDIGIAKGMGQIIPDTLSRYRKKLGNSKLNPFDPDDAITLYQAMMVDNTKAFGNYRDATRAYNAGWKKENWKYADKYMADIDENLKKYADNRSAFTPKQILDNAVNKTTVKEKRNTLASDGNMKQDEQFIIDMNNLNRAGNLPYQDYGYTQNADGSFGDKIDWEALKAENGNAIINFGSAIDIEGTPVNKNTPAQPKQDVPKADKIRSALKKLNTKSDFGPIGRDTRGIAMMMDANAAASGGNKYLQPLLNNQAFTGVTPEEQIRLFDEQERSKANILASAYDMRNKGVSNMVNDQMLDRNLQRGLNGDAITALQNLYKMNAPAANNKDSLIEALRVMSQSKYPTETQSEDVQRIQEAIMRSKGL